MAVKGADVLLYVNNSVTEIPNYVKIAGQRNASLSRSASTIDSTSKDTEGGYITYEAGLKEFSVSCEALVSFEDEGFQLLETAFNNNDKLLIQLKTGDGTGYNQKW